MVIRNGLPDVAVDTQAIELITKSETKSAIGISR
jgi:hypothetical protein